ncbi:MAG TPA: 2-oxoacid:acceptor oxidoreductase family protein [Jatrophihabitans sp.]|nr:2-oxoacid:acceptor oxidoreductase family protein [Jatrophihabitans sp.]
MEIRVHGRGGQGVVTLAELIALAAFDSGHEAQAIPSFGSERMGAPVMAFCRIADRPIRTRQPVTRPDLVAVCDPTLLHSVAVFDGLRPAGWVLLNSTHRPAGLGLAEYAERLPAGHLITLPATALARELTGGTRSNSALLGAIAAVTGLFDLVAADRALRHRFGDRVAGPQSELARAAYERIAVTSRA